MKRGTWLFLGTLAVLLAAFAGKHLLLALPAVEDSPAAGAFNAHRAYARLERILGDQRPHPVDSDASDGVRDRLVTELRAAGLEPRVTDAPSCNHFARARTVNCSRIRNVVVTIGPAEGRNLLFVSHYDSSASGPGAADDGIGVASMIEVAALLRNGPLKRPVTFLFNEGEETGLNGARAFLDSDPVAANIDFLVNLEARGTEGPAIMFETSRPNGEAIRAFAAGSARPFANSLSTDFYRLIPNSTDVTVFGERPWTILNFAIIGNETRYHTAGDDLASLDRRSLQHMGREALGVAQAVAVEGTAAEGSADLVYADFYGLFLVTLPLLLGLVLLGALILFFGAAAWRIRAFGRPFLTVVGAVVGAALLAWVLNLIVSAIRPADYWRGYPLVTFTAFYSAALLACGAAIVTLGRSIERDRLRIAAWLLVLLLGGGVCLVAPGAAIYFLFPPLLAAIGLLLRRFSPVAELLFAIAAALLQFLTFAEIATLIELLLIDGPYWILAPLGALAALPILIETRPATQPVSRATALAPMAAAALALWAAVLLVPRATADRQQVFTVEYFADLAGRTSFWGVSNKSVPLSQGWASVEDWRLEGVPYSSRARWIAPAPPLPVAVPGFDVIGQQPEREGRRFLLALRPNGADAVSMRIPAEGRLLSAGLPGHAKGLEGEAGNTGWVRCHGRACDGMQIELLLGSAAPVEVQVLGTRYVLPPEARPLVAARPANNRPQYTPDSTYVIRRVRL